MPQPPQLDHLSREELIDLIHQQQRHISDLDQIVARLNEEIERLKRAGKRSAAPFSTGQPVTHPKRPGRHAGEGSFSYREAPPEESYQGQEIDAPLEETCCPRCGGELAMLPDEIATITEVPQVVAPEVVAYRVARACCRGCGHQVRGRHPDLAPGQHGASAHRLGRRLLALAHWLHYGQGVSLRKVPSILFEFARVRVTQGALTQDALRQASQAVGKAYQQLRQEIRQAPVIHTDDTSWKVGGKNAFLMTFVSAGEVVYQVRERHRNEEVREVVPEEYAGTLVTDRGRSYDARELAGVAQQKCLAHVLRNLSDQLEGKQGRGRTFALQLKKHLQAALELWQQWQEGQREGWKEKASALVAVVSHHLRDRLMRNAGDQRLLNELGWHHDRGNLLRFLSDPRVPPTNNLAERMLRPPVIGRKVSQCSKTTRGAEAMAAHTSVIETLRRRGAGSVVDALIRLFGGADLEFAVLHPP